MSCCPPNSLGYLQNTYSSKGSETLFGTTDVYISGDASSNNVVVMIPDVYGWKGGRMRALADYFGDAGYLAVVPKLLQPAFNNDAEDGLPGNFDWSSQGTEFGQYMLSLPWEGSLKPRIASILDHIQSLGDKSIVMTGCCWGGLVLAWAAGDYQDIIKAGVIFHPSLSLEERIFGGNSAKVAEKIKCPILLMPAGNDPPIYRTGGDVLETLKSNNSKSNFIDFPNMQHGWVSRGDVSDPDTKEAVQKALTEAFTFFQNI
jgi:dienelactone hydrolase